MRCMPALSLIMSNSLLSRSKLITNDAVELLRRDVRLPAEALRYTHPGMRGLFGGIWRTGRTYAVDDLGFCFGPEIFFLFGADEREAQEAFDRPRAEVRASEAVAAREAFAFLEPLAREFGGEAELQLVDHAGDRHIVQAFIPTKPVLGRFRPHEWFSYWKDKDAEFRELRRKKRAASTKVAHAA